MKPFLENLVAIRFIEVSVQQLPDELMHRRPHFLLHGRRVRGRDRVVGVLDHRDVARVQRERGLLAHHLLQVDLGPTVGVSRSDKMGFKIKTHEENTVLLLAVTGYGICKYDMVANFFF